jgi:hypothetical protein
MLDFFGYTTGLVYPLFPWVDFLLAFPMFACTKWLDGQMMTHTWFLPFISSVIDAYAYL